MPDMRLRPYLLVNYLTIRHALGLVPESVSAPDLAAISRLVRRALDTAIATARHVADDTAECFAQASDTANVRDAAWSDEHARMEGAGRAPEASEPEASRRLYASPPASERCDGLPDILLDPVGVFTQSADETARGHLLARRPTRPLREDGCSRRSVSE